MNEAIQKFKEILDRIQTVSVVPGSTEDINKLLSAAVLHKAFIKLNKKSILQSALWEEKTRRFVETMCGNLSSSPQQENIIIKLDAKSIPISELQYEKEGDIFKIILQSSGAFDPHNVIIEKEQKPVDLLLLIDPKDSEIESLCANTPHREVIKLSSKDPGLMIKIFEILSAVFATLPNELANPLWYLVSQQEKELKVISPRVLEIKKLLSSLDIDWHKINEAKSELLGSSFWKLLGRALTRSEYEKRTGTIWSFLPQEDFQKTGQASSAVSKIMEELRALRPEGNFFALLWEDAPKSIHAIVGGNDNARLSSLAALMQSQLSSTYFFVHGFETFSEAELKIRSHIQRVL